MSTVSVSVAGSSLVSASVGSSSSIISATATGGVFSSGDSPSPSTSQQSQAFSIAPGKLPGMIYLSTCLDSGTFSASVRSSTGYVGVLWWDGTNSLWGSGNASSYISITKAIPTTGSYQKSSPKVVYFWPATNMNYLQSGDITGFTCSSKKVVALSTSDCTAMTALSCDGNSMEFLDISRCAALTTLTVYGNRLRSLDITPCTLLTHLYCQSNLLTTLDVTKSPLLRTLQCNDNSIASLNLSLSTALLELFCYNNLLTSLAITTSPSLTSLNCSNNRLTSLRAVGCRLYSPYGGNIESNLLTSSALDQFYSDLGQAGSASAPLFVAGNTGISGDTPSIATGKGYAVNGS